MDILLDWYKVGLFAFTALIVSHVVMYQLRNRSAAYGIVIYLATLIGGLSLLLQLYQSDEQIAKWWRPSLEIEKRSALDRVYEQIEWEKQYYCDGPQFVKTEYSPPNFDQLIAANAATCRTMQALDLRKTEWALSADTISLPELQAAHFEIGMPEQSARSLREVVRHHNQAVAELRRLDELSAPTPLLQTLTVGGPYALIVAFAVGLASIAFPAASPTRDFRGMIRRALKIFRKGDKHV